MKMNRLTNFKNNPRKDFKKMLKKLPKLKNNTRINLKLNHKNLINKIIIQTKGKNDPTIISPTKNSQPKPTMTTDNSSPRWSSLEEKDNPSFSGGISNGSTNWDHSLIFTPSPTTNTCSLPSWSPAIHPQPRLFRRIRTTFRKMGLAMLASIKATLREASIIFMEMGITPQMPRIRDYPSEICWQLSSIKPTILDQLDPEISESLCWNLEFRTITTS